MYCYTLHYVSSNFSSKPLLSKMKMMIMKKMNSMPMGCVGAWSIAIGGEMTLEPIEGEDAGLR
jgi:hypothetical protein